MAKEKPRKARILIIEDDKNLNAIIEDILKFKGYDVISCHDGEKALIHFKNQKFDLLIMDVMIPNLDGFTLCREIRKYDEFTPIIFLSVKNTKLDTLEGYKAGADTYITKPFEIEDLLKHIEALLRKNRFDDIYKITEKEILKIGDYTFDTQKFILEYKETKRKLTKKEGQLLKLLYLKKNDILLRSMALRIIWGAVGSSESSRSIDVYISKLRKYLANDNRIEILNIHGVGFKLTEKDK